jgi:putative cell surface polysaccharide biosynthesis
VGLIILCGLLGLAGGLGYVSVQPKLYTATSQAMVVVSGTDAFDQSSISGQKASVYAALAGSQNVANRVAKTLKTSSMEGTLSGSADAVPGLFTLTATASTPERARDIANAGIKAVSDEANAIASQGGSSQSGSSGAADNSETRVTQTLKAFTPSESSFPTSNDFLIKGSLGTLGGLIVGTLLLAGYLRITSPVKDKA